MPLVCAQVETFERLGAEALRQVLWAKDCGVVMFPPFYDFPDFGAAASKDVRNFVRKGFKTSGTVIFVGGSLEVKIINDIFGFEISPEVGSLSRIRTPCSRSAGGILIDLLTE